MANGPEVAKAYVTIIPSMEGAQRSIKDQLGSIGDIAGAGASDKAGASFLSGFATKMGGLKGIMAKALPVASVAAVGKALFNIGSEFDEMTDTIIIGTGASGQALEDLKQSAMDMATAVPMSFGDAGDIVQDLNTRLGLTGDTLTEVGTQIAQVGHMTGEAFDTEAFSGAMSVWGVSADEMSGKLDTLFAVSQSTGLGINKLTGIVETSGPQMKALGYSIEDTAAMAGLLDKAGLDANGTMSKMSKALTTLAKDGEEPADAMKRVTEEIGAYIEKGDEASAIAAASELFGTKGAAQFVAAVQSGSMSIEEFSAAMADSSGIIGDTANETMDFGERVTILKNQFKELLEPMGSAVFAGLSSAMTVVSNVFSAFVNGPGKVIGELFKSLMDGAKQLGEMFVGAFKDTSGINSASSALSTIGSVLGVVGSALKPVANIFKTLLQTVLPPLARLVGGTLGAAFRTISGIIRSVAKVFEAFKKVIEDVKKAFEAFKRVVSAPFRFLSGLEIPKISISGGKLPYGIGGAGVKPSISVKWAAQGGVLDGATLIGAGEAGKEALLPLERNTEWADIIADKIGANGSTFNITLNANGTENPEQYAQRFARELKRQVRMGAI